MGAAIGGALPLAVGVALSPVPIIAVVLMLTTRPPQERHPGRPAVVDGEDRRDQAAAGGSQTGISGGQQAIAYLVFTLIGTIGVKLIDDAISGLST